MFLTQVKMNSSINKIPAFITVRSQSSRLPNKCFLPFGGVSVLEHVILRVLHYGLEPIICTSTLNADDKICEICEEYKIKYFRGPLENKMLRWSKCCDQYNISSFHTVDADDPFFCGEEIQRSFSKLNEGYDIVAPSFSSSRGGATVGYSITASAIKKATLNTNIDEDTESVWNFIENIPDLKTCILDEPSKNSIIERMTLDYKEDYFFLNIIREKLGSMASRQEIYNFLKENPEVTRINSFRTIDWAKKQKINNFYPESKSLFSVENYEVIVVGGANGIGEEISIALSKNKAKVTIFDVDKPRFKEQHHYFYCDLKSIKSIENTFKEYCDSGKIPKILINSAGITFPSKSEDYSLDDWNDTMMINLSGTFYLTRLVGKKMIENKQSGSIINITSIGAHQGFPNNPAYAASKGGLRNLTKSLALDWGEYGIRVNNLAPGYTKTKMNLKSWEDIDLRVERSKRTIQDRWAETNEFIGPIIFLSSDASSYITGIDLVVDGGWISKGM